MEIEQVKSIINRLLDNSSLAEKFVELAEEKGSDLKILGKTISALSNEAHLAGVANSWLLIETGRNTDEFAIKNILETLSKEIPQFIEVEKIGVTELKGKLNTVIRVGATLSGYPAPFEGHFYGIENDEVAPLTFNKLDKIRYPGSKNEWITKICENATPKDLDQNALRKAKTGFKSKHLHLEKEIDTWSDIEFLNKTGLARNGKLLNAAIVLLGREEAEHLINPVQSGISWVIKDAKGNEKGYQHFGIPLILQTDAVLGKISNLRYDYATDTSFAPVETTKYEASILRELITNAIAHQDYSISGKINVVEEPDRLIITNSGTFIQQNEDIALDNDSPALFYRNPMFVRIMEKLNLLDLINGGIRKVMNIQRKRNFPMPDYDLSYPNQVKVILHGKVLNKNYTEKLVANPDLSLIEVRALDKVQKNKLISEELYKMLRTRKLVTGRYPDLMVASKFSAKEGEKPVFVQKRVYSTAELKQLVIEHLTKVKESSRGDIDKLLMDKYPEELPADKRRNKIKNLLYQMSRVDNTIANSGSATKPVWTLA